ncbi:hypothetical protein SAMN05216464_103227 [Mucilaginibacter pineti]|uniref:Uncharacterized protein n=2 Tax=Mucilaginibacter pineti TaxID=1391627 RepID=A0A1G6Z5B0_9SPHI|nr:hypothetical protein SAMN05216464_103227 [Mucilaginibacter pineti]
MLLLLFSMSCSAQPKVELSELRFNEDASAMIKDVPDIHQGQLFDRTDMVSYGVSKNTMFYFKDYLPLHVELLSYKGQLTGYAFRMRTFGDQQKVESYFKAKYKMIPAEVKSKLVTSTKYADDKILVEFDAISKESFEKGMFGYVNVRRPDFAAEYERLMQR